MKNPFPKQFFLKVGLRKWCMYGAIVEMVLFFIPAFYSLIFWDDSQPDNRILFGTIFVATLVLSVLLGVGGYNREAFYLMVWIAGTILVQYIVIIVFILLYLLEYTYVKIWGNSIFEMVFKVLQAVIGLLILYPATGYFIVLNDRYKERIKTIRSQMSKKDKDAKGKRTAEDKKQIAKTMKQLREQDSRRSVSAKLPPRGSRTSIQKQPPRGSRASIHKK